MTEDGCLDGYALFTAHLDPKIIRAIQPELEYPRWEKLVIKRKYGSHLAICIDVWKPKPPTLFSLLPRFPKEIIDYTADYVDEETLDEWKKKLDEEIRGNK